jgi:hypothetical protein
VDQLAGHLGEALGHLQRGDEVLHARDDAIAIVAGGHALVEAGVAPVEVRGQRRRPGGLVAGAPQQHHQLPRPRRALEVLAPEHVHHLRALGHVAQRALERLGGPQHAARAGVGAQRRDHRVAVERVGADQPRAGRRRGQRRRILDQARLDAR